MRRGAVLMAASTEELIAPLHDRAKELVRLAVKVGWTAHPLSSGAGVNLIPPGPGSPFPIYPVRQWNEAKLRTAAKKILHYGNPELVKELETGLKQQEPTPAPKRTPPSPPPATKATPRLKYVKPEPADPPPSPTKAQPPATPAPAKPGPLHPLEPAPISGLRPWMAKAFEGVLYPSTGVLERVENGETVYVCIVLGCCFESDNPYAVRSHYNRTADHNANAPRKIDYERVAVLTDAEEKPAAASTDPLDALDALRAAIMAERKASDAERLKRVVVDLAQERDELLALLELAEQELEEWREKWNKAAAVFGVAG